LHVNQTKKQQSTVKVENLDLKANVKSFWYNVLLMHF